MADEILFLGNDGVKLNDLIAVAALALAIYSAWLSWANDRRDRKREEGRTEPRVRYPSQMTITKNLARRDA